MSFMQIEPAEPKPRKQTPTESLESINERIAQKESERAEAKRLNLLARAKIEGGGVDHKFDRVPYPRWYFTNLGAEIRRLKQKAKDVITIEAKGWSPISTSAGHAEMEGNRIYLYLEERPPKEIVTRLKRSPIALKYSHVFECWTRKHTIATQSEYFRSSLLQVLKDLEVKS